MLRAAAQHLARVAGAAGTLPGTLEAAPCLRGSGPALTLTSLRHFSSVEPPSGSGPSDGGSGAGQGGAGSSGRPASKEWRTWVDAKLDSKLEGEQAARCASRWADGPTLLPPPPPLPPAGCAACVPCCASVVDGGTDDAES